MNIYFFHGYQAFLFYFYVVMMVTNEIGTGDTIGNQVT